MLALLRKTYEYVAIAFIVSPFLAKLGLFYYTFQSNYTMELHANAGESTMFN